MAAAETYTDDELLYERAQRGWKVLYEERATVDPWEVLAAIVWPTEEMVQAQIEERRRRAAA